MTLFAALALPIGSAAFGGVVTATFEDLGLGANTSRADFRPTNQFSSNGFTFNNNFVVDPVFGSFWTGIAASTKIDNTFPPFNPGNPSEDFSHLYGAYAPVGAGGGTGSGGSATYAIVDNFSQGDAIINLPSGASPVSIDITNTTYDASAITQGDHFARAFHSGDFFKLDILGFSGPNGTGTQVGDVPFFLADFRGPTLQLVSNWTTVSLAALAGAQSLEFALTSTDTDPVLGMNTPATFAIDNVVASTPAVATPEPATWSMLALGFVAAGLARRGRRR
jgi:hypothetical protein